MERVIYGPGGEIARRVVVNGGLKASSVIHDETERKVHVHRVFDAQPAMELAHAVRTEIGPWSGQRNLRRYASLPTDIALRLMDEAKQEAKRTKEPQAAILSRKVRAFVQENPAFGT